MFSSWILVFFLWIISFQRSYSVQLKRTDFGVAVYSFLHKSLHCCLELLCSVKRVYFSVWGVANIFKLTYGILSQILHLLWVIDLAEKNTLKVSFHLFSYFHLSFPSAFCFSYNASFLLHSVFYHVDDSR